MNVQSQADYTIFNPFSLSLLIVSVSDILNIFQTLNVDNFHNWILNARENVHCNLASGLVRSSKK